MKAVKPTKAEVAAKFEAGFHCAHCSLSPWADALGYDEEELYRISGAFGGGMFRGDTCGGVSGSLRPSRWQSRRPASSRRHLRSASAAPSAAN